MRRIARRVVTIHKANTPGVDVCFGVDSVCVREAPSGRVAVLVDQSAEEVNPFDPPNRLPSPGAGSPSAAGTAR